MGAILIVNPDRASTLPLVGALRDRGHRAETRADTARALSALAAEEFDLVLLDVPCSRQPSALREILQHHPGLAVVCVTDEPTVGNAVELMRAGAYDYMSKPLVPHEIDLLLARLAPPHNEQPDGGSDVDHVAPLLSSTDPTMAAAIEMARQAANADVPILLVGESGTGKRTLAEAIHRWSGRRARPFITVWCAALAEQQVERRLIGHLRGAFTMSPAMPHVRESAMQGGTIFFDDVGNSLPQSLQVKLIRLLEQGSFRSPGGNADVDVRVIAAAHHDLAADVHAGRLRQDLFFRLNVVTVRLPPLRARPGDLTALRDHVLANLSARHCRPPMRLTPQAEDLMSRHQWPGNVRELISVLESAVVLAPGDLIDHDNLATSLRMASADTPASVPPVASLEEMEQQHIRLALQQSSTFGEAAARLHINPATLWRKRKRYRIDSPRTGHRIDR